MDKLIYALILLVLCTIPLYADTLLDSTLKDGISVRALGMGGAFTALSNDASCIFYNPAGLGFKRQQFLNGDLDMKHAKANIFDYRLFAVSNFGFGSWRQENLSGEKAEVSSFSYGKMGENGVAWGFTYKKVQLSSGSINGWAVDGGLLYPISPEMRLGIAVTDAFSEKIDIQPSVRAGVLYLMGEENVLTADLEMRDLKRSEGMRLYFHYGAEVPVTDGLVLRGGWEKDRFSAGVTAELPFGTIDYAVSSRIDALGSAIHRFGWRLGS